jgi:hypothetical protein
MVWQLEPLFATLAQATAQHNFQGAFYRLGLQAGAIKVVINPALQQRISPTALQTFDQALLAIQLGTLRAPYIPH